MGRPASTPVRLRVGPTLAGREGRELDELELVLQAGTLDAGRGDDEAAAQAGRPDLPSRRLERRVQKALGRARVGRFGVRIERIECVSLCQSRQQRGEHVGAADEIERGRSTRDRGDRTDLAIHRLDHTGEVGQLARLAS